MSETVRGQKVGEIIRLQVQQIPIKSRGVGYFPERIVAVDLATVDAQGMVGWDGQQWILDAHHMAHPSRGGAGKRPLSVGFTGHYAAMAERFGSAPIGVAGENMIVDGPEMWLDDLGGGLVIDADGGTVLLERPRVAAPCLEFTSFMLDLEHVAPLAEIADPLADLHDGRRGFIVAADTSPDPVEVHLGDSVFLAT